MQNPIAGDPPSHAMDQPTTNRKGQSQKNMKNQNHHSSGGGNNQDNHTRRITDHVNYRSADGLVEVRTKVSTANRFPKHGYPVVCLHLHPEPGCRVQPLDDGSGGCDVLFSHAELIELLTALNAADSKCKYTWQDIAGKPPERKAYWDGVNQRRQKRACGE
jgi:hypothetical protein